MVREYLDRRADKDALDGGEVSGVNEWAAPGDDCVCPFFSWEHDQTCVA